MIKLSVNINKVATVRNSRGGREPSVIEAVRTCIDAGAPGITVHPRADARHITRADVEAIAGELQPLKGRIEYNIEGDPRPDLVDLVLSVRPDQCTLVPVKAGEITSEAGWPADTPGRVLGGIIESLQSAGIRVSLFIDPEPAAVRWAREMHADRVELYTEPFARAFERGPDAATASFEQYAIVARLAHELGVGVNAGHDLDLKNLTLFRDLPHLDEVSIGHALISRALFVGLGRTVREYLAALALTILVFVLGTADARASGRAVTMPSADGTSLAGEIYETASRPAPGVVLVHMQSRSKADWESFAERLQQAGLTALAVDLRGHGGSSGSRENLQAMVRDVTAAVQWLAARPGIRPGAIAIVGASLGANLALLAAADSLVVKAVGLLSPSLDYRGLRIDAAVLKKTSGLAMWMAAATEDPFSLRTLKELTAAAAGSREQRLAEGAAHGTALLAADPEISRALVDWLRRSLLS